MTEDIKCKVTKFSGLILELIFDKVAQKWGDYRYRYKFYIKKDSADAKEMFYFHGSVVDYRAHKKLSDFTDNEMIEILDCILHDGVSGNLTYLEFFDEFGYDIEDRVYKVTWQACITSLKKLLHIFEDMDEIEDMLSAIYNRYDNGD